MTYDAIGTCMGTPSLVYIAMKKERMTLKIAVVGHIRHPIAAPFMGGMEAHCAQLVRALGEVGHDVTLFASTGSDAARLHPICAPHEAVFPWDDWRETQQLTDYKERAFQNASKAIEVGDFDVIHNNSLSTSLIDWACRNNRPMVTSQHVPPFAAMRIAVDGAQDVPSQQFTVTSENQLALWNGHARSDMRVVYNGIDLSQWNMAPDCGESLVWFGRITQNKGLRETVKAARIAQVRLDIAGYIEDRRYFEDFVAPYLGDLIRYDGHLSGEELRRKIASARAAVVTPMWDEPFGLVAAEAMASGVPVIAFDRGAMREVLGNCGTIVPAGDVQALAAAMEEARYLDGTLCRDRITRHFSVAAMIRGYEKSYAAAIAGASLAQRQTAYAAAASNCANTEALLA